MTDKTKAFNMFTSTFEDCRRAVIGMLLSNKLIKPLDNAGAKKSRLVSLFAPEFHSWKPQAIDSVLSRPVSR